MVAVGAPVFSTDERRVYKLLREALPHHIVLSKLPLVRFSQPTDPTKSATGTTCSAAINVTFAICSANGRVLAAIDLDTDRGNSRRILQIKQSVLGACRIRYLRCPVDNLPHRGRAAAPRAEQHRSDRARARSPESFRRAISTTRATRSRARSRRGAPAQRAVAGLAAFQDSFFAPDTARTRSATASSHRSRMRTARRRRATATATTPRPAAVSRRPHATAATTATSPRGRRRHAAQIESRTHH
jgi:hypothetical protein